VKVRRVCLDRGNFQNKKRGPFWLGVQPKESGLPCIARIGMKLHTEPNSLGGGSFTDLFIKRPVLAVVVALLILVAGVQAIFTLTIRQYPRSDNASVTITTIYVGANAELVRGFITTPIERAIAAADGIDYVQSESLQGRSLITARLKLNYDPTKALSEISSKVDQVRGDLPPEAEVPIIDIESADSKRAAAYLRFVSDILKPNEITDYLTRVVQPRLTAVPGVQRAEILGGRTFAMRIWLKPDRMAALNISPAQVRRALAGNNYLSAVGQTKGSLVTVNLTANTDLSTVEEFNQLVLRESGGAVVRLKDIADVELGAEISALAPLVALPIRPPPFPISSVVWSFHLRGTVTGQRGTLPLHHCLRNPSHADSKVRIFVCAVWHVFPANFCWFADIFRNTKQARPCGGICFIEGWQGCVEISVRIEARSSDVIPECVVTDDAIYAQLVASNAFVEVGVGIPIPLIVFGLEVEAASNANVRDDDVQQGLACGIHQIQTKRIIFILEVDQSFIQNIQAQLSDVS
jgi:hypothetical protein